MPRSAQIICLENASIILFYLWGISVINNWLRGRYLVTFLEVPEMFQKVLEYVRESRLAIWEELRTPQKTNDKQKTKKQHNIA